MIYNICNFTRCYDDIPHQRMGSYTCKPKTRRQTFVWFFYTLDAARDALISVGI